MVARTDGKSGLETPVAPSFSRRSRGGSARGRRAWGPHLALRREGGGASFPLLPQARGEPVGWCGELSPSRVSTLDPCPFSDSDHSSHRARSRLSARVLASSLPGGRVPSGVGSLHLTLPAPARSVCCGRVLTGWSRPRLQASSRGSLSERRPQ